MIGQLDTDRREDQALGVLEAAVLEVAGRALTGRDLVAAGIVSGRWQHLETQLYEGLALAAAQRPPLAETREEVNAFRLERKLLSAEDMRGWLRTRGLTMSALNAAAERAVARRRGGASTRPPTADEVRAALAPEAICTGAMVELGWWLADRILSALARELNVEPIALEDARIQRLVFEEARSVAGATSRESGLERGRRLAWIAALDDAHRAWEDRVTGERDVARILREHQLDWTRLGLDELRLPFPGAAAEAARQLAEGKTPEQVARAAGASLMRRRLLLADAPPNATRMLAGAVPGDVIGPFAEGDEHVVAAVRDRAPPDIGDDELLARAREELLADAASRLRAGKVRWHDRA